MGFVFLKIVMRICQGIFVVETCDKTDVQQVVLHPIDPSAAVCICRQRESKSVINQSRIETPFGYFPDFFYAQRIDLWITTSIKSQSWDDLFGQRATRSFAKNRDFCHDVSAGLVIV